MSNETNIEIESFLTFKLGEEVFAVKVEKVMEIQELKQITKVPKTPSYMKGVVNLRGNVLPVIDTRIKFGLSQIVETVNTCILVLKIEMENDFILLGLLVDSVQEVLELPASQINPPPSIGSKYKSDFIIGMGKIKDDFIMLLDIDKIFSVDDIVEVQQTTETY
ncbi:MAG TPA: chemotaxis protein CheW [Cytophagaceae bacterium]|jgi:purine-binding chemotaxis protein CheW|nr:chemotaxis protein CheW [Cytophagaceae bacterium]